MNVVHEQKAASQHPIFDTANIEESKGDKKAARMDVDEGYGFAGNRLINTNTQIFGDGQNLNQRDQDSFIRVGSQEYNDLVEMIKEDAYQVLLANQAGNLVA